MGRSEPDKGDNSASGISVYLFSKSSTKILNGLGGETQRELLICRLLAVIRGCQALAANFGKIT